MVFVGGHVVVGWVIVGGNEVYESHFSEKSVLTDFFLSPPPPFFF